MSLVWVAAAGGFGAVCRFLVSGAVAARSRSGFPYGTAVVNLAGAFLIGLTAGALGTSPTGIMVTGFLGGFTTFSTWMVESIRLGRFNPTASAVNVVGATVLGVALAAVGFLIAG